MGAMHMKERERAMKKLLIILLSLNSMSVFAQSQNQSPDFGGGHPQCGCSGACPQGAKVSGVVNVNARTGSGAGYYYKEGDCVDGDHSQVRMVCLYEYGGTFFGNSQEAVSVNNSGGVIQNVWNTHIKRETGWKKIYFANVDYQLQGTNELSVVGRVSSQDYEYQDKMSDFGYIDIANPGVRSSVQNSCDQIAASMGYRKVQ